QTGAAPRHNTTYYRRDYDYYGYGYYPRYRHYRYYDYGYYPRRHYYRSYYYRPYYHRYYRRYWYLGGGGVGGRRRSDFPAWHLKHVVVGRGHARRNRRRARRVHCDRSWRRLMTFATSSQQPKPASLASGTKG